jgi:hypothetical protein
MREKLVDLVHGDQRFPLEIKGTVLGGRPTRDIDRVGLTFDLRQPGMDVASKGDLLVSID